MRTLRPNLALLMLGYIPSTSCFLFGAPENISLGKSQTPPPPITGHLFGNSLMSVCMDGNLPSSILIMTAFLQSESSKEEVRTQVNKSLCQRNYNEKNVS